MHTLILSLLAASLLTIQEKPKTPVAKSEDYESQLNDILSKGISPEKNANVLLWKALGPSPEGGPPMPAEFYRRLGIPEPPKEGAYFVGLQRYPRDHLKLEQDEHAPIYDEQGWATQRPWSAKDYPRIAAWLQLNEKPLALAIEASKRPQYYSPLIASRVGAERGSLIGSLMPGVQVCRELAVALCARAMLRVEAGKVDEAWHDLLACHRLGRLVARGATNIDALVGIAVDHVASNADLAYLERAELTSKQILDCLKDLQALPPMPPPAEKVATAERYIFLNTIQIISRGGDPGGGPPHELSDDDRTALAAIHWGLVRADADKWFGRMADALRVKDRSERDKAFGTVEREMEAEALEASKRKKAFEKTGAGDVGQIVGKEIGMVYLALLAPSIRKVQDAKDRSEQIERNLHIAFALAAYHADNGRYPAKLDDLAPKYLAAVPDDLFTGNPLTYLVAERGYLFYSFGVNGKDDEGRWTTDKPAGDDPRVQMPLPPLRRTR